MSENDHRCHRCEADCCRYISVSINKPKTKRDHDEIRWFLRHKNVNVYIDHDKEWILEFVTPCESLKRNRCVDYENRPDLCRAYDPDICPANMGEPAYTVIFHSEEEYNQYLAKKKAAKKSVKKKKGK